MLLWTYVHRFLCGQMFSFLLSIYVGIREWDGWITMVTVFNRLRKYQTFPQWPRHIIFLPAAVSEGPHHSTSFPIFVTISFLIVILVDEEWWFVRFSSRTETEAGKGQSIALYSM